MYTITFIKYESSSIPSYFRILKGEAMKKPDIKSLDGLTPDDAFTQTAQAESDKGQKAAKKTFSLQQRDIDYINAQAVIMAQEVGKVVSASEALRYIIQRDRSARV